MGCHLWLYKKASSFSKDEWLKLIKERWADHIDLTDGLTREEFIDREVKENEDEAKNYKEEMIKTGFDDYAEQSEYQMYVAWSNPEYVGKKYDLWKKDHKEKRQLYSDFIWKFPAVDVNDFIKTYSRFTGLEFGTKMMYHNGDYYVETIFDTYFRCFEFAERPMSSYDELIEFLEGVHPNLIVQYGEFIDDKFVRFDKEITGLTDDLKKMLRYLYRNDDIFIYFG